MPSIHESIVIDCPQETVFEFSSNPKNVTRYSPSIVKYEQVEAGPLGLGSRIDDKGRRQASRLPLRDR